MQLLKSSGEDTFMGSKHYSREVYLRWKLHQMTQNWKCPKMTENQQKSNSATVLYWAPQKKDAGFSYCYPILGLKGLDFRPIFLEEYNNCQKPR